MRKVARRLANGWREEKLKEQEKLRHATQDKAAVRIAISPRLGRKTIEAWWLPGAILLEPQKFGRINCTTGWIEVLPIGNAGPDVAAYLAQIYADCGDDELATEAARNGLSLSQIQRVMAPSDWQERRQLMNELVSDGRQAAL